jgi:hypothetical protein
MYQIIKLLKKTILKGDYNKLFSAMENINYFLKVTFPITELVKYIYNRIAYHLFENENSPKKLRDILNEILMK